MSRSKKTNVIRRLFAACWDPKTRTLIRTRVTTDEVMGAIQWANRRYRSKLSPKNPANFIKDVLRGQNASKMWPRAAKTRRWSAVQITGGGDCFEFVPYGPHQKEPFEDRFRYRADVVRHRVQSLSIPTTTKELGRNDETYLIQVAAKLAVVETHLALETRSRIDILEVAHLQVGIKLRLAEVDSLYAATYKDIDGRLRRLMVTVEAKKKGQRIIEEQIVRQVHATFKATAADLVVPLAMVGVGKGRGEAGRGLYVAEFAAVAREDAATFVELVLAGEAFYELVPPVKGL